LAFVVIVEKRNVILKVKVSIIFWYILIINSYATQDIRNKKAKEITLAVTLVEI